MGHGRVPCCALLAAGMTGKCVHECVHLPTCSSTAMWVLVALFAYAWGRQLRYQCHTGASGLFAHACGCQQPVCTCVQALAVHFCMHVGASAPTVHASVCACAHMGARVHFSLLLSFSSGHQPGKVGEFCFRFLDFKQVCIYFVMNFTNHQQNQTYNAIEVDDDNNQDYTS